jgi:hypothetical protein
MLLKYHNTAYILCLSVLSSMIIGCGGPLVSTMVDLNRERYICKIDQSQFREYRGKRIFLTGLVDESKNTSNFHYYNPKQTIVYNLFYSSTSMPQPVVSYYWYALQKAFECVGIKVDNGESYSDAELSLTFKSLTDEEIQFDAGLIKNKRLSYSKIYVVKMPIVETNKVAVLEQRAYGMLDSIVTTILNDPDFNKALLMSTAPAVYSDPRYSSIKGIVLKNGDIIRGKILNINIDKIIIQTTDGAISSYSFDKEVATFIKE